MITISITEETHTKQDMAYALREIAKNIEEGYLIGISPNFELDGEEEEEED